MKYNKTNIIALLLPLSFLAFVGISTFVVPVPKEVFYFYIAISVFLFVVYGVDKNAARNGSRRISESNLHLIALAGGWPGALFAQQYFRHKTQKKPFLIPFWITVVLNGAFFIWLITPEGLIYLSEFI